MVTGLNNPNQLYINGDYLYFSEATEVSKINITQSSPTPISVASGFLSASGLAMDGKILYIAEFFEGRISKIDVSDPNATVETLISGLNTPNHLLIYENFLLYSDNNSNIIGRIDLTDPNPTVEVLAHFTINFFPIGLALDGNILYMCQSLSNRVSKIDITNVASPVNVVTALERPLGICLSGNNLFIAERDENRISIKDLSEENTSYSDFVTGLNAPKDVAVSGTTL